MSSKNSKRVKGLVIIVFELFWRNSKIFGNFLSICFQNEQQFGFCSSSFSRSFISKHFQLIKKHYVNCLYLYSSNTGSQVYKNIIQTWKEALFLMCSNAVSLHENYVLSKMVRFCLLLECPLMF